MSDSRKPYHITELRGLACLLLVAYHVVGVPGAGMQVDDHSLYRYATGSFELIRMPLFTFLSGLVYAYRPVRAGWAGRFLMKKLRRLGLPFLIVSTLFYMAQTHAPGANGAEVPADAWRIYLFSYAHFWYLQSLLLLFAAVAVLDSLRLLETPVRFAVAMTAAVAGCLTVQTESNPFSVNEALVLLPHFLLGLAVTRFGASLPRRTVLALGAVALGIGMTAHQASLLGLIHQHFGWNTGVALLCGMGGAVTLLHTMPHGRLLRTVGRSSYAIYLWHAFFTAAARIVLHKAGAGDAAVFFGALACGIAGPMVLEAVASIRPLTRVALVGKA